MSILASIHSANGTFAGTGFVAAPGLILTCAHVVNTALGRRENAAERPDEKALVEVWFEAAPGARIVATVDTNPDAWSEPPFERARGADICVLRLREQAPDGVVAAECAAAGDAALESDEPFQANAFGYPSAWTDLYPKPTMDWAEVKVVGLSEGRLWMLRAGDVRNALPRREPRRLPIPPAATPWVPGLIHHGYSGGPLQLKNRVIGMVAGIIDGVENVTAYAIPSRFFPKYLLDLTSPRTTRPQEVLRFERSSLWLELQRRAQTDSTVRDLQDFLRSPLSLIEGRLETAPQVEGCTLYDRDHSFRLAQRVAEVVPTDVLKKLSNLEITFLILLSCLIDVGIAENLHEHHSLFRAAARVNSKFLETREADDFRHWLDLHSKFLERSNSHELLNSYCHDKNAEWGAIWIRKALAKNRDTLYPNWIEDIVRLLRGADATYEELDNDRFDPITRGGAIIHIRYLAAVLRISNVLEYDPKYTASVLFQRKQANLRSRFFELREQIVFVVEPLPGERLRRIRADARPSDARSHYAILTMLDAIDAELTFCGRLELRRPFDRWQGLALPHGLNLLGQVVRTITPEERDSVPCYEYIDGRFRPDTSKLLELLAGTQLYGSELAAIRELLQNAYDAVYEHIARVRLTFANPHETFRVDQLHKDHLVRLRVEARDRRVFLICEDSGVGMSKTIIRDYFLVSGRSRRQDIATLERQCRDRNFSLERTGQFGIGALSYFMLADRVVFSTRRQDPSQSEAHGWRFEIDGVSSFGQLRSDSSAGTGTVVELRVRGGLTRFLDKISGRDSARLHIKGDWEARNRESLVMQFHEFVKDALLWSPCRFEYTSNINDLSFSVAAGTWTRTNEMILQQIRNMIEMRLESSEVEFFLPDVVRIYYTEGRLPGGHGNYRLALPYFDLPGGSSLAYFDAYIEGKKIMLRNTRGKTIKFDDLAAFGWKGMRAAYEGWKTSWESNFVVLDINWKDSKACQIDVSRRTLKFTDAGQTALGWLKDQIRKTIADWLRKNCTSPYHMLSCHVAEMKITSEREPSWIFSHDGRTELRPIPIPTIHPSVQGSWRLNGQFVSVVNSIDFGADISANSPDFDILLPDRVVTTAKPPRHMFAAWTNKDPTKVRRRGLCDFPPGWEKLCGFILLETRDYTIEHYYQSNMIWNSASPIVRLIDVDPPDILRAARTLLDKLEEDQEAAMTPANAAAMLLFFFWDHRFGPSGSEFGGWMPGEAMASVLQANLPAFCWLERPGKREGRESKGQLLVFANGKISNCADPWEIEKLHPPQGPEWTLDPDLV